MSGVTEQPESSETVFLIVSPQRVRATPNRAEALREAEAIGALVVEAPLVADFRRTGL